jgi:hypothetical protein
MHQTLAATGTALFPYSLLYRSSHEGGVQSRKNRNPGETIRKNLHSYPAGQRDHGFAGANPGLQLEVELFFTLPFHSLGLSLKPLETKETGQFLGFLLSP